jgi:hypothetical protein
LYVVLGGMTEMILRHPRFYAVQNGLAALIFGTILLAEALRHLLYQFPQIELFWRLTSIANYTVGPVLNAGGQAIKSPMALIILLGVATLVPVAAWRRRHWLSTAISGHVSLACMLALAWFALKRNNTGVAMASLSNVFEPRLYDTNVVSFAMLSLVMLLLCVLNHVAFFKLNKKQA